MNSIVIPTIGLANIAKGFLLLMAVPVVADLRRTH
jgi:hypothetical protein